MVTHSRGRMCAVSYSGVPEGQRRTPSQLKPSALYGLSHGAYGSAPLVRQDVCELMPKKRGASRALWYHWRGAALNNGLSNKRRLTPMRHAPPYEAHMIGPKCTSQISSELPLNLC